MKGGEGFGDSALCFLRVVVFLREVAEPETFQEFGIDMLAQDVGALRVAEVSKSSFDSPFQREGVRSTFQHVGVVVGLYDQILCLADIVAYFRRGGSCVGDEAESDAGTSDEISCVVG